MTPVFYETSKYEVKAVPTNLTSENCQRYGVVNKETKVVEYFVETLDNAMIAAETLTYILTSESWKIQVQHNIDGIRSNLEAAGMKPKLAEVRTLDS
jgi:hypothetical protein